MSDNEVQHLEAFTHFYAEGDAMDERLIRREMDVIRRYCGEPGKSALEVGCGSGSSTQQLASICADLEVVEPVQANIDLLHQRMPSIPCHALLLEDFCPGKKYDYIFFLNVLEHVQDPVASLTKLSTLLKDEGLIFISVPNCMSLNRRAGYLMGLLGSYDQLAPKDIRVGHRRLYTRRMLEDHCAAAQLRVVDVKGLYLKPLSEKQMSGLSEAAIDAFHRLGEDIPEYCASLLALATKHHY